MFFVILDIPNTNLPCQILKWIKPLAVPKGQLFFMDYNVSNEWRDEVGLQADRIPKLFAVQ